MNYSEIEKKYEDFLNHEKFPEIEEKANSYFNNVDDSLRKDGNWTYNKKFLGNYFEKPKGKGKVAFQSADKFSIVVNEKKIDLNTNEAPNFRDQDEYLKWLHTELSK